MKKRTFQTNLIGTMEGKTSNPMINPNILQIEVPKSIKVYYTEIVGEIPSDLTHNELYNTAIQKLKTTAALLIKKRRGFASYYLVSLSKIKKTVFRKNRAKFVINESAKQLIMKLENENDIISVIELLRIKIQENLEKLGYVNPINLRTNSNKNKRHLWTKLDKPVYVLRDKLDYYHIYSSLDFRVYHKNSSKFWISIDQHFSIVKSSLSAEYNFSQIQQQTHSWVNSEEIPKSLESQILRIRKTSALNRYNDDRKLLKSLDFDPIIVGTPEMVTTNEFKYLEEPEFIFGDKKKPYLEFEEKFEGYILKYLKKYGPAHNPNLPTKICARLYIMDALNTVKIVEKIKKCFENLSIQCSILYRLKLTIDPKIVILPKTEAEVEHYCSKINERFQKGEFDIGIFILKGKQYNHPFRKVIKKGLKDITPSQVIKYYNLRAPKIFVDIMKTSLLPQIIYKASGVISVPINNEYLKEYTIRIFYKFGIKRVNGKPVSMIGGATLVNSNEILNCTQEMMFNEPGSHFILKKQMVKQLIIKMVKKYLTTHDLKCVKGNILIQRIGKYGSEAPKGVLEAINKLKHEKMLKDTANWTIVEYIVNTPVRLFSHEYKKEPHRGTFLILNPQRAFITTTGSPDIHSKEKNDWKVGVARTMEIRIIASSTNSEKEIIKVAKDLYYRTFMWEATFKKTRLPQEAKIIIEMLDLMRQGVKNPPKYIC